MNPHVLILAGCLAVFGVASLGLTQGVEPFLTWYYSFAWWPAIFAGQSGIKLKGGRATLWDDPRLFAQLPFLSLTVWLIFEACNFRLGDWAYLNLPQSLPLRWLGYVLSFASVLPALVTAADVLEHLGLFAKARTRPLVRPQTLYGTLASTGVVCLVLPLAWPEIFFQIGRAHV